MMICTSLPQTTTIISNLHYQHRLHTHCSFLPDTLPPFRRFDQHAFYPDRPVYSCTNEVIHSSSSVCQPHAEKSVNCADCSYVCWKPPLAFCFQLISNSDIENGAGKMKTGPRYRFPDWSGCGNDHRTPRLLPNYRLFSGLIWLKEKLGSGKNRRHDLWGRQ